MDIKSSVLLWVYSTFTVDGRIYVKCDPFFDESPMGGSADTRAFSGLLQCLSEKRKIELTGKLSVDHISGLGSCVRFASDDALQPPCLMTDCREIHCIFHGPVSVVCSDENDSQNVIAAGLPLVSAQWIGFIKCVEDDIILTAFGVNEGSPIDTSAFCPWWAESTNEPDATVFHIHSACQRLV